jgi:hypothetical protein
VTTVDIDSRLRWVRTGIVLRAGRTYRMTADGTWHDKAKACGPEGYASREYPDRLTRLFLRCVWWTRRKRRAPWLALVGVLDAERSTRFVIGRAATFTPRVDGELLCFANDAWTAYRNNCGVVQLTVVDDDEG